MPKTVYYSKKFNTQQINSQQVSARVEGAATRVAARRITKAGPVLMLACLAVAVMCVLLVPMLVGGTVPGMAQVSGSAAAVNATEYDDVTTAMAAIGLAAELPTVDALPEGSVVTRCAVLDGSVLELEINTGSAVLIFRAAAGSDDLSGADYEQYPHSLTETVEDVTLGFAGVTDKKLNLAVWLKGGNSYALVCGAGMAADDFRQLAENLC